MEVSVNQPLVLRKKSRSSRHGGWSSAGNKIYDKLFRALYIFLLVAFNFVMFIYSVNGKIIESDVINPAIVQIFSGIGIFAVSVIILSSFSKNLQNAICAIMTLLVIVLFFNQFALFNVDNFLEKWLDEKASWLTFICVIPSSWLVGLFVGILIFFLFRYTFFILFITMVLFFAFGSGIKNNEFLKQSPDEYFEAANRLSNKESRDDNIVYFMMPKLSSYQFYNSIRDRNFRELRDLMIGFYALNSFEVFPNAFVKDAHAMSNVIDIFNQVDYNSTTSADRKYSEYINSWNFIHGSLDVLGLDENRLYNYLHENNYQVSIYSMPSFNLCLTSNQMKTERCVLKNYKFHSFYDKTKTLSANVNTLLAEWVLSFRMKELNSFVKMFIKSSSIKGYKVASENRRMSMIGSPDVVRVLSKDFKDDTNGKAYLVYVDLPSDLYIYDEYCRLKPEAKWVSLKDGPYGSTGIDEKRKAYVEQTKCAIGLLQTYMDTLYTSGKAEQTDVIVQGVSPIRELAGMTAGRYGNFVKDNLVTLAIRQGQAPRFLINANICLASDFTKTLIRYQDYCYTVDNMKMPTNDMLSLKQNLINNAVIRGSKISNIGANYKYWYETFQQNNPAWQKAQEKSVKETKNSVRRESGAVREKKVFRSSDHLIIEMDDNGEMTNVKNSNQNVELPKSEDVLENNDVQKENNGTLTENNVSNANNVVVPDDTQKSQNKDATEFEVIDIQVTDDILPLAEDVQTK